MGLFLRLSKYDMKRYKLHTLIDVTETNARRGEDLTLYKQQQNWMTLVQTLGLRCNPIVTYRECNLVNVKEYTFGTDYKGEHRVWTVYFEFDHAGDDDLINLVQDFNLVPVASWLEETIPLSDAIFQTKSTICCNILFSEDR